MEPIQLLIIDDNEPFRRGLRALLRGEADIVVVGEAADGRTAVTQADILQPDVVVMDLKMPLMDGLDATRRILHTSPHVRVLVLTMAADDESVFAALQAGARGYLLKGALKGDVLRAIRGVAVAQRLLQHFATLRPPLGVDAFPELTEREHQVLGLLAHNRSNPEIAERLGLSEKTVRNHVSNICTKLQVADRTQAIFRARDAGLGRPPRGGAARAPAADGPGR
jgi:DNA-binding NarL/FixJ family response regulator